MIGGMGLYLCIMAGAFVFSDHTPSAFIDIPLIEMENDNNPRNVLFSKISSFKYINFQESLKKSDAIKEIRRREAEDTPGSSALDLEIYPNIISEVSTSRS
jgi:hypothetical protein